MTVLRSSLMIQGLDAYYPRGYCLFYNTFSKIKTQSLNNKSLFYSKECKTKESKRDLLHDNTVELGKKKDKKNKKKTLGEHKQEQNKPILTIGINITNILKKKKRCHINKIMCFNCNKKSYYDSNYTKPKNKYRFQQF